MYYCHCNTLCVLKIFRLPRWLYRIKSAVVDALVIGGGVVVLLLIWTYFFT